MPQDRDVVVLVGSLRAASISRRIANALIGLQPKGLAMEVVEIGDLPLFNEDLEAEAPPSWTAFRERVRRADAALFVTPEYNRSIPSALKNALDVGSRPYGQNAWKGKAAAVVSQSPGMLGAFGANHHLRQCLVFLDMPTMAQPEAYLSNSAHLVGADGTVADEQVRGFLVQVLEGFAAHVEMVRSPLRGAPRGA